MAAYILSCFRKRTSPKQGTHWFVGRFARTNLPKKHGQEKNIRSAQKTRAKLKQKQNLKQNDKMKRASFRVSEIASKPHWFFAQVWTCKPTEKSMTNKKHSVRTKITCKTQAKAKTKRFAKNRTCKIDQCEEMFSFFRRMEFKFWIKIIKNI